MEPARVGMTGEGDIVSWFGRAREVVSDVLIATALMWTPPLLLGGAAALARFLLQTR